MSISMSIYWNDSKLRNENREPFLLTKEMCKLIVFALNLILKQYYFIVNAIKYWLCKKLKGNVYKSRHIDVQLWNNNLQENTSLKSEKILTCGCQ